MIINNLDLSQFRIKLLDSGIGIDDSSVTSAKFTLTSNGVTLVAGTDYQFVYNANTDEAFFYPTSGLWTRGPTYVIRADNTPGTGIRDFAGNALQANKLSGETSFTIATGAVSDWGNAPDSTLGSQYNYHTRSADLVAAGPSHAVVPGFRLVRQTLPMPMASPRCWLAPTSATTAWLASTSSRGRATSRPSSSMPPSRARPHSMSGSI